MIMSDELFSLGADHKADSCEFEVLAVVSGLVPNLCGDSVHYRSFSFEYRASSLIHEVC